MSVVSPVAALVASIPSPSSNAVHLGPFTLRAYGVCIALGVVAAVWLAGRRYEARGGDRALLSTIAMWGVPAGIVGARLYHVITDYQLYTDDPIRAFNITAGGLGIWGGVAGGLLGGAYAARKHKADVRLLMDMVAPAIPLAQAIGRWGNWFNQELFGRPTKLPWGLRIDPQFRPDQFSDRATFHPTFLYECLWDLCVVGIVLLVERRVKLKRGYLFGVYIAAYTFGRFFTEYLRIDQAHRILGLRINDWTSIIVFLAAMAVVLLKGRGEDPAPDLPVTDEPDELGERDEAPADAHVEEPADEPAPADAPDA